MANENRVKILRVDAKLIVDILNWWRNPPGFLTLPLMESIPEDSVVVSVHADWSRGTIEVLIQHHSFDIVPRGEMPPIVPDHATEFRIISFNELIELKDKNE